jgi:N-formylglutamate amidohydrolase
MIGQAPAYAIIDPPGGDQPLLVAVAHAGRIYPPSVMARARVSLAVLESLEDRHADALIDGMIADGASAIVASLARAAIDFNRSEREIDPGMIDGALPWAASPSPRTRSGLGLIPRRLAREGDLWRHRLTGDELESLVERAHRPFHRAIADRLDAICARHGQALLIDCHSMPPLPGPDAADVVIGTLGGRSCDRAIADAARRTFEAEGLKVALNQPYAGGHTIDRHGRPALGRHAIQIELDRSLYLQADLRTPDPTGVARATRLLRALAPALLAAMPGGLAQAAE